MSDLRDPFNPKTGEFADNIRVKGEDDLTELKESMKKFGWIAEFPALMDEHEVVLVGHRRLKVAKQLNIEPVIKQLTIGAGDEADAARLALAIASNIGGKPLTRDDRIHIAKYLYGERDWTMQKIGEALSVTKMTISNYLVSCKGPLQPSRPKGGRPKGKRQTTTRTAPSADVAKKVAKSVLDDGLTLDEAQAKFNLTSVQHVKNAVRDERKEREVKADPEVNRADLSLTAQQKFDAAVRQYQRKLDDKFEQRVHEEIKSRLDEMILPHWKKQIDEARRIFDKRRGILKTKREFNLILGCLHPDSRLSVSDDRLNEAFRLFNSIEKFMLDESQSPTEIGTGLPRTMAEWDKMKAAAATARRAKRGSNHSAMRSR